MSRFECFTVNIKQEFDLIWCIHELKETCHKKISVTNVLTMDQIATV